MEETNLHTVEESFFFVAHASSTSWLMLLDIVLVLTGGSISQVGKIVVNATGMSVCATNARSNTPRKC